MVQTASVTLVAIALGAAGTLDDGLLYANVIGLLLAFAYLMYLIPRLVARGRLALGQA